MVRKVAVLATASSSGEIGGAERFYQGLCAALCEAGADAEIVPVVSDESSFVGILESYLRFYDLDLARYDGVISSKAPAHLVRHPNHVCYLLHTIRVFYDMFDAEYPTADAELRDQRKLIHDLDTAAFRSPRVKDLFVIGEEVRQRLLRFNGIASQVLYPSTTLTSFRQGPFEDLFIPGRLHRWKRVDLIIEAMRHVRAPVKLLISGTGEDEGRLKALAKGDTRIVFLGRLSDEELLSHYANAIAVPFVPCREDFGLVAVEAFLSGKPVITCADSGEPARMTAAFEAGLVCDPTPMAIASAIESLIASPEEARRLGENGRRRADGISWRVTALTLMAALNRAQSGTASDRVI